MTKKNEPGPAEPAKTAKKPAAKLHLHGIRSEQAADGSIVHHHTYKDHKDAKYTHPERGPMATSGTADEAGQHVAEQFGMNGMSPQQPDDEGAEGEAAAAPAAAAPAAAAPPQE